MIDNQDIQQKNIKNMIDNQDNQQKKHDTQSGYSTKKHKKT